MMNENLVREQIEDMTQRINLQEDKIEELTSELNKLKKNLTFELLAALSKTENYSIEFNSNGKIKIWFRDDKNDKYNHTSKLELLDRGWEQVLYNKDIEYIDRSDQEIFDIIKERIWIQMN